jgi:hypothetical protein
LRHSESGTKMKTEVLAGLTRDTGDQNTRLEELIGSNPPSMPISVVLLTPFLMLFKLSSTESILAASVSFDSLWAAQTYCICRCLWMAICSRKASNTSGRCSPRLFLVFWCSLSMVCDIVTLYVVCYVVKPALHVTCETLLHTYCFSWYRHVDFHVYDRTGVVIFPSYCQRQRA